MGTPSCVAAHTYPAPHQRSRFGGKREHSTQSWLRKKWKPCITYLGGSCIEGVLVFALVTDRSYWMDPSREVTASRFAAVLYV